MGQLVRDSVFLWRSGVIEKMIALTERMKKTVHLLNVLTIILNVPMINAFQAYGFVTETTIVGTTQMSLKIVRRGIALKTSLNALPGVAYQ